MEKRVLIIRNAFFYDFGGGERMPVDLAAELAENDYEPLVISRSPKLLDYAKSKKVATKRGWWWSRQNWSGFLIVLAPFYLIWEIFLTLWYLLVFVRFKPDIVHAQSKDDFIAASLAGRLTGAKVIWSDHADLKYVFQNVSVWYKNPVGKLVRFCSRLATYIILTSQNDKKQIENALNSPLQKKYLVIYNGIADRPELLDKRHPGKAIIFATTSRLVTEKGIGEVIEAFKTIRSKYPSSELWLIGEGPEEGKFKELAKGAAGISFKGFLADPLELVAKADVFVHPSYMEGFSLSIVEAAMLAKPIIACNVGGNPEIIRSGKNGFLIAPRDPEELARAMEQLAGDSSLRTRFSKEARRAYENNFVFKDIIREKYLPLYER